ncbi:hypothetical protein BDV24DRAFT_176164 [Aspergillus arachidicola]|uniref:Aminoglycoside phosphotransferase domain-containing protein n=1 Tax=Aspergillus arachidicola TaxID=656916 RepID=A0A5N6Y145_9EURO|nr:hypothetical protein BDV24DRAFT_176164 [Aspergillus arachidicola]
MSSWVGFSVGLLGSGYLLGIGGSPDVFSPDIHGILPQSNSKRIFLFMSRAPGEPLDTKWKYLDEAQKISIREQLESIMDKFRHLPAPPAEEADAVLGGGNPRRCKDVRRQIRVAEKPISNEHDFNISLTSNKQRTRSGKLAMIESYLETSHQVVLTHADLRLRNIMVAVASQLVLNLHGLSGCQVRITGILDWEMCGWYPEYWEYVKALHTITPGDGFDDWWAYLPRNIGV